MDNLHVQMTDVERKRAKEGQGKQVLESLLNRFNRKVQEYGVLGEVKKRRFYEKPSVKKRRKKFEARVKRQKTTKEMVDTGI